jgi:uncharacterized protein with NAD-binding domain and iron-sulfur cluster
MASRERMTKPTVAIVGGGVAGLTAAHELVERGFEVTIYERREAWGGKAASGRLDGKENGRPTEHGFRFFPGWYRHVIDTMGRIPYLGKQQLYQGRWVKDNLVRVERNLIAEYDRGATPALMHVPRNLGDAQVLASFVTELFRMDMPARDITLFFQKLAEFMLTPEDRRRELYDKITWVEFIDAERRSKAFRALMIATTRIMVAAKATEVSAYTIAKMAIRTLFEPLGTPDHVLDGPTEEKWIDPWLDYLRGRGVQFRSGVELQSIEFDGTRPEISHLRLQPVRDQGRLRFFWAAEQCLSELHWLRERLATKRDIRVASAIDGERYCDEFESIRLRLDSIVDAFRPEVIRHVDDSLRAGPGDPGDESAAELERIAKELRDEVESKQKELRPLLAMTSATDLPDDALPERLLEFQSRVQRATQLSTEIALLRQRLEEISDEIQRLRKRHSVATNVRWERLIAERLSTALKQMNELSKELGGENADQRFELLGTKLPKLLVFDPEFPLSADDANPETTSLLSAVQLQLRRMEPKSEEVHADYFVFALPIEQMAYYANRSTTMTHYDPSLKNLIPLSESLDWMAGIQFYLREPIDITSGHIVCMDSEWALTAIEQTQFWKDVKLPKEVRSVLSVDVAAWDQKGRFNQKEAFNCTPEEIAEEVWGQLEESLNKRDRRRFLSKDMLVGGALRRDASFHLDDSIVERFDRKKQAWYEKQRGRRRLPPIDMLTRSGDGETPTDAPYIAGERPTINAEPLLINRVGMLALRPSAETAIGNMFLAGDYIDTSTNLASMEGANESARRAVNAILEKTASSEPRCRLWSFEDDRIASTMGSVVRLMTRFVGELNPRDVLTTAASATRQLASQAAGTLLGKWKGK